MTKQKNVKAISRNKTWGSEIVQSSEDNVKFGYRNSDNLLQRKLDVLKLACNQKSDKTTTLTLNEIVQEKTQALVGFAPLAPSVFCAARQNAVLRRSPLRPT